MCIRFCVANEEFLQKLEGYIKYKAETSRDEFSEVPSRIFNALIDKDFGKDARKSSRFRIYRFRKWITHPNFGTLRKVKNIQ